MKTYKNLYSKLCSWENLEDAYWKAREGKSKNPKVQEFEKHWRLHLCVLMRELRSKTYRPEPLKTFVLRDPKTRRICVSAFRDRIVHHGLVNILQPIFESRFICDSYASRKGKGALTALERFDEFKRKASRNRRLIKHARNSNEVRGFVFKADVRHYFETVDHHTLISIIKRRVRDKNVIWLVQKILENCPTNLPGKGMPLGNWTSQFFANVYLNELDQFVKHELKAAYYLRYVDDFIIFHRSKDTLRVYADRIRRFLSTIRLELHPTKSVIIPLSRGVSFLGFRNFYYHRFPMKRNICKLQARISELIGAYGQGVIGASDVLNSFYGWNGYALHGNTYHLRTSMYAHLIDRLGQTPRVSFPKCL